MKIVFITDPHLTSSRLNVRKDFFPDTMADKLVQSLDIAMDKKADLWACGGDFRHGRSFSTPYLNKIASILKSYPIPKMCVLGNHDEENDDPVTVKDTPLGNLIVQGTVGPSWGEWVFETDDAICVFLPFMVDPSVFPPQSDKVKILFSHYFFQDTRYPSDQLPEEATQYYDYIFLGHDHDVYEPTRVGRSLVIRPGSLSRGTRHKSNWDRDVFVAYLDTDTKQCEYIPLRTLPAREIFSEARLRRERELQSARDVSSLTESISVNDPTDVATILDESQFPEAVKERTRYWLRSVNLL